MSITEDDIRLEQLRRLRAQAVPPPQPDVIPPSQAMVPPDLSAYKQADALTRQAAPPPDPYAGMGTGKQMLMRGLAGAAGGAIHAQDPGGYTGYLDRQQQVERQREQDLLGRAKELRGEGLQREQLYTQEQDRQAGRERQQGIDDLNRQNIVSQIYAREHPPERPDTALSDNEFYLKDPVGFEKYMKVKSMYGAQGGSETPHTIDTDKGIMQWNPETKRFDIPAGNKAAPKAAPAQPRLITTVDEKGRKVQKFVTPQVGSEFTAGPTAQEENRRDQARIDNNYADHVMAMIDQNPKSVGPILGRIARGEIAVGSAPPEVQALHTALMSFEALQPILHGFRGGSQTVDHFHAAIGSQSTNAAALKASLSEIKALAQQIETGMEPGVEAAATETRIVNGVTYMKVGNEWHKK